jgi:hypothetical protein
MPASPLPFIYFCGRRKVGREKISAPKIHSQEIPKKLVVLLPFPVTNYL